MYVVDATTGRFLDVNDRACQNLGYSRDELLALGVLDIELAWPMSETLWTKYVAAIRKRGTMVVEGAHRRKDGSSHRVEISLSHVQLSRRESYLFCVVRDITDRWHSERRLRQTQALLLRAETLAQLGSWELNLKTQGLELSPGLCQLLGIDPENTHNATITDALPFLHPDDVTRVASICFVAWDRGRQADRLPSATPGWFVSRCAYRMRGWTRRQRRCGAGHGDRPGCHRPAPRRTAVRDNEQRLRSLLDGSWDMLSLVDQTGHATYLSPAVERILGYTLDQVRKLDLFALVHPDDLAESKSRFRHVVHETEFPIRGEVRMRHRDGSWRWIETLGRNLQADPAIGGDCLQFA